MKNLRQRNDFRADSHPDFEFVRPGEENVFVVGFGDAGKVFTDYADYKHFTTGNGLGNGHLYIKCYEETIASRIKDLELLLREEARMYYTTTVFHCTRKMLVEIYRRVYEESKDK